MKEIIKRATRESYGIELAKLGEENKSVVVLDADLSAATKTSIFAKTNPDRFFNMGIAEQDMFSTAAGISTCGNIVFASTFAVFAAGRSYDQIRNSICYPNLNVKIGATHAGISVGEDGATHQMIEDMALMRALPNMKVISPCDDFQTKWAVQEAAKLNGPVYLRLSRPAVETIYDETTVFEFGKGIKFGDGEKATVIATGIAVHEALKAKKMLEGAGIFIRVIDIHTIKPIDKELIIKCAKETEKIITIEDHSIIGGLGSAVCEVLSENYPKKVVRLGVKDKFGTSGKTDELMKYYGITYQDIIEEINRD